LRERSKHLPPKFIPNSPSLPSLVLPCQEPSIISKGL
jgi:hypothetical protein